LTASFSNPGGDLRPRPQPAVGGGCAQRLVQLLAECGIEPGAVARLVGLLARDSRRTIAVIAARRSSNPRTGPPDAARRLGGDRALGNEVEGVPARFLLRLRARALALV
jgi:hypothetical protein